MSSWRMVLARFRPARDIAAAGFTLIELMVSITLLTVVSTTFLAATNAVYAGIHKQQGVVNAADGNRRALSLLDKQVRYASAINTPGTAADGNFYMEYLWTKTSTTTIDAPTCSQWRLDPVADLLQYRYWTSGAVPSTTPTWTTVDTGVSNVPSTNPPFALLPPPRNAPLTATTVVLQFQELQVNLTAKRDKGIVSTTSTLTALNSVSGNAPTAPVCQEVARS